MTANRDLIGLLSRYGYPKESAQALGLLAYLEVLDKWNRRINLTASTAWADIRGLFEEALWAASLYPPGSCRHLDVGSGAGFPALPLRILLPEMQLTLVESRLRKAVFLETAIRQLGLTGAHVFCGRVEDFPAQKERRAFDRISWKAVKLSPAGIDALMLCAGSHAEYWLFHGRRLPFQDPLAAERRLELLRRETFPGAAGHFLSVFRAKPACFP